MIYYLASENHAPGMRWFLAGPGRRLAHRVTVVSYERLIAAGRLDPPAGTYIFTGLAGSLGSRNPPSPVRRWAGGLHALLVERYGAKHVLNDPFSSLTRLDLLSLLRQRGVNRFAACRASEGSARLRFPVFLRPEHGTVWNAPALISTREEYDRALAVVAEPAELIALEFCDTSDVSGEYRKYGAFVVGERIVPRHLFFSRNWLVKAPDITDPLHLREELAYVRSNPHEPMLLDIARWANISYGRIDYAILDGQPQVWEINLSAQMAGDPKHELPARTAVHAAFIEAFTQALDALDLDDQ